MVVRGYEVEEGRVGGICGGIVGEGDFFWCDGWCEFDWWWIRGGWWLGGWGRGIIWRFGCFVFFVSYWIWVL